MPRTFGSLKSWEIFVTPTGKRYKKTTKAGTAAKIEDDSILVSFAENDAVLSEEEWEALQNPEPAPGEPPAPPEPVEPPTPAPESSAEPVAPEPPAPIDPSEFDAPAPGEPPAPPEPVQQRRKK